MKTALIVLAGCIGFALLLFGSCAYLLSRHGPELLSGVQALQEEGRAFGAATDQRGCEEEALRRQLACNDLRCRTAAGMFLSACFQAAAPTPGYCRGVPTPEGFPGPGEMRRLVAWQMERCEGLGRDEVQACSQVSQAVSQLCVAAATQEPPADAPSEGDPPAGGAE